MAQMTTDIGDGRREREGALHPLDPLTPAELQAVVDIVRAAEVARSPPPVRDGAAGRAGQGRRDRVARRRRARPRGARRGVEPADGDHLGGHRLGDRRGAHLAEVPGAKAPALIPQAIAAIEATKADPRIREGLREARHHRPLDNLHVEPWPYGSKRPAALDDGRRLAWTPMFHRTVARRQRLRAPDPRAARDRRHRHRRGDRRRGPRRAPGADGAGAFPAVAAGRLRGRCSALEITQPDGPGFTVDGWQVRWQKWSLRVGFCPREGLVIHDVRYDDDGTERRIAHRLSIAELVIPYGDPSPGSYPQERVRHGRGRHGLLHQLAGAGLRLPGRDPLPGRGGGRRRRHRARRSRTASACTRRTTASSGSTPSPTGTSRCGAAAGSWCRRSSRSTTTSTATTGTSARTARSSSRPS